MTVKPMLTTNGNRAKDQSILTDHRTGTTYFQSYQSIIVRIERKMPEFYWTVYLDKRLWDCSKTTGKYRNIFLGESKRDTMKKIKSGEYLLVNLN